MKNNINKKLETMHSKMVQIAMKEVERLVRKTLSENPELHDFLMGMGTTSFMDGINYILYMDKDPRLAEVEAFIDNWDKYLYLTGNPMRIRSANSLVETDW